MSNQKETLKLSLALIASLGLVFAILWSFQKYITPFSNNQIGINNPPSPSVTSNTCQVSNMPTGTFNYGGSTTWAPIRGIVEPVLESSCPQFILRYTQPVNEKPGSGTGIKMLIENQLAFSQSSRAITGEENQKAQKIGFSITEIPVAIDGIAIAVNPDLNIPGITVGQLKDIYTGKITNWQQVGGANLAITPISRTQAASGTVEFFVDNVLNKQDFAKNVVFIDTTTEALRKIATTPGAIYYASAPEVVPQCVIKPIPVGRTSDKLVAPYQNPYVPPSACNTNQRNQLNAPAFRTGEYPITRNLFVIVKQNGQIDQQAGEAYANWLLTPQAQALIEKAGFFRIR